MKLSVAEIDHDDECSKPIIIVMTKAPRAGEVKTRLCPPLTAEEAADLASCFLRDSVACAISTGAATAISCRPAGGRRQIEPMLPGGLIWLPQRGDTLGTRMQSAIDAAAELGCAPIIVIGTDSPTLPSEMVHLAIAALSKRRADVVLGPADDGGYYLVGVRGATHGLFDNVAWSTPGALADTVRNAESLRQKVHMLPAWHDVDTPGDLERLRTELRTDLSARERAPRTLEWLEQHEDFDNRPYA